MVQKGAPTGAACSPAGTHAGHHRVMRPSAARQPPARCARAKEIATTQQQAAAQAAQQRRLVLNGSLGDACCGC
jgi:hypothetical protein